jgi:starch synthase
LQKCAAEIYSLKYGTVPIVPATGGLDDTIEPWDARTVADWEA